ncbi:DNase I-like protein, partial [Polyporus arcularius HHB13444]
MVVLWSENATANNTTETYTHTDRTLGNWNTRLSGAGDGERDGAASTVRDSPGADGRTGNASLTHNQPARGNPATGGQEAPRQGRKRKSRGRVLIATLNMRGFGTSGPAAMSEKWMRVNQILRDKRVAVLGLQETHLTIDRIHELNDLFGATMRVFGSPDPENPQGARGVAFAVNTRIVDLTDLNMAEIIPGRAAALNFRWTGDRKVCLLNVYAPNSPGENGVFWSELEQRLRGGRTRKPEIVLGDFNLVEDALDRLPTHGDQSGAVEALGKLMAYIGVSDGWRVNNPRERMFTYLQTATGSQSRIDRIYVTDELMRMSEEWLVTGPGIVTDHRMVQVSLANYKAPKVGKGRWALPRAVLMDGTFAGTMKRLGMELQTELNELTERTSQRNPQILYGNFKEKLRNAARARAKALIPKIDRRIEALEEDMRSLLGRPEPDEHDVAILQEELVRLETKRFDRKRGRMATKDWLQGESMSRYWTKLNAPQLPS